MSATHETPRSLRACRPDRHYLFVVATRSWRRCFRRKLHLRCWACGLDVEEP